jgi:hypothetical protein
VKDKRSLPELDLAVKFALSRYSDAMAEGRREAAVEFAKQLQSLSYTLFNRARQ